MTQAALEQTARYVAERKQFGKPIGDFGLTRYHLGRMATPARRGAGDHLRRGARRWTPTSARPRRSPRWRSCSRATSPSRSPSSASCSTVGWGYAEEYPISRYVADAQVLPIFEGVKPILALKVIGRSLLGR